MTKLTKLEEEIYNALYKEEHPEGNERCFLCEGVAQTAASVALRFLKENGLTESESGVISSEEKETI